MSISSVRTLCDRFGPLLRFTPRAVNNAGSAHGFDYVGNILDSDIDVMFTTNVLGLISVTQLLVKGTFYHHLRGKRTTDTTHPRLTDFKARNAGHIINVGSIAGRESYAGGGVYCASKAAVRAFTGSLLREVVNTPIRVTEIQPGPFHPRLSLSFLSVTLLTIYSTHRRNGG